MEKIIDCFFIGHNEMEFVEYEKKVRKMGTHSGAYRDLNLNFIQYNHKPYSVSNIFNFFYFSNPDLNKQVKPLHLGETFSAAIAYLGTYLNRRGLSFDYVNSFGHQKEELAEKLKKENIRTVGIITTLYVSVFPILEIMDFIKKYNQTAKVIIGGPFVSTQFRTMDDASLEYLLKSIDADCYVNSAQGEATLVKIIHALSNNLPLDGINNIYYKSPNGCGYVSTPILEENNQLSEHMVNWDLFSDRVGEYASIRTSISCPFSCAFCGFPQHAGKYQAASVEAIEKELRLLNKIETVKSVQFIDDTFNIPVKRFKEILKMLVKNKIRFKWYSHFRCQFADREMVELMKESGCEGVFLGIESGNDQILKNMKKAADVDKYLKGIALLNQYEILTYGSFIIGFPGETKDTVKDTVQFIREGGLDFFRTQLWYCEPITPVWQEKEKYNLTGKSFEWSHATMDSPGACDLVEDIFLSIDNPIWVPQYNFECDGLFHLIHRGFTWGEVKNLLRSFTNAVREKLVAPSEKEISFDALMQLKKACLRSDSFDDPATDGNTKIDRWKVIFDF
jgi:radical SAM PhpK family P-methyltransferase